MNPDGNGEGDGGDDNADDGGNGEDEVTDEPDVNICEDMSNAYLDILFRGNV